MVAPTPPDGDGSPAHLRRAFARDGFVVVPGAVSARALAGLVAQLRQEMQAHSLAAKFALSSNTQTADLGDAATKQKGAGVREPGRLEEGDPRFDWKPGQPIQVEAK